MPPNMLTVGSYIPRFNQLTGQSLPCGSIYQSQGLMTHVQKRHPADAGYVAKIPDIIRQPDYVGKNPKEPNSIELVKNLGQNVMACIKLDQQDGYFYVASLFVISPSKLQNRINSGRLKAY